MLISANPREYSVLNLTNQREEDFQIYEDLTRLFTQTFPKSSIPDAMYENPADHINTSMACVLGNRVVGGLKSGICEESGLMTIELIAVQKASRGLGVGSMLLETAETLAKKEGIKGIKLIPRSNEGVFNFYMNKGYDIVDDRDYIIWMQKLFSDN